MEPIQGGRFTTPVGNTNGDNASTFELQAPDQAGPESVFWWPELTVSHEPKFLTFFLFLNPLFFGVHSRRKEKHFFLLIIHMYVI